jgi:hypothetical protein
MSPMRDFEKLGVFYLGKLAGPDAPREFEPLLYDSKDLTTHGVIVGMTGSGKTGLGIGLIEEAAIDGIRRSPSIQGRPGQSPADVPQPRGR